LSDEQDQYDILFRKETKVITKEKYLGKKVPKNIRKGEIWIKRS